MVLAQSRTTMACPTAWGQVGSAHHLAHLETEAQGLRCTPGKRGDPTSNFREGLMGWGPRAPAWQEAELHRSEVGLGLGWQARGQGLDSESLFPPGESFENSLLYANI